jgi:hypothetical protein
MSNQTLKEFLQHNLSWHDYEHLNEHLGESQKATTILINDPSKGSKLQGEKIAELVSKTLEGYNSEMLVQNFGFGVLSENNN